MSKAKSIIVNLALVVVTLTIVVALGGAALQDQTLTINVANHRPLASALDAMEAATGIAFNYEDVPYENAVDLEDISTPRQRALHPGYRLLVPRKGQLTATVQIAAASSVADGMSLANLLLDSYRDRKMPGDFRVEAANGMVYVVATRVRAVNGAIRQVSSPMAALATVPNAERTVADTVAAILGAAAQATRTRIAVGQLPFSPAQMVVFGAAEEPARDALARLFSKVLTRPASYRLLFDPLMAYMFNLQPVPYAGGQVAPATKFASPTPPRAGGPFFVKPKH